MKSDVNALIESLQLAKEILQGNPETHLRTQSVLDKLKKIYGDDDQTLLYQVKRYLQILRQFVDRFGEGPVTLMRLPSRICIIGGHTDYLTDSGRYLLGHVLTFANPGRDMLVAIRYNQGRVGKPRHKAMPQSIGRQALAGKLTPTFRLSSTEKRFEDKRFAVSDFVKEVRELSVPKSGDDGKTRANRQILKDMQASDSRTFWMAYLDLLEMERKAKKKPEHSSKHWDNYVKASVYYYLVRKVCENKMHLNAVSCRGFDMVISSDIPVAGGASSSSALVVASDIAVRLRDRPADLNNRFKMEAARHTPLAEWFVGTRGGSMDQATIALGESGTALRMSFSPFEMEKMSIPRKGYKWVTIYTHPHGSGSQIDTGYNERSAASLYIIKECIDKTLRGEPKLRRKWENIKKATKEKGLKSLEKHTPDMRKIVRLLPDYVTLAEVRRLFPAEVYDEMQSRYGALFNRSPRKRITVKKWALHHFREIRRVLSTVELLKKASAAERQRNRKAVDRLMKQVGKNITESGKSLRDNYGLSTPDLDRVISIALATKGVLGAYIHGGGFGGSALVLVREEVVGKLIKNETEKYYRKRRKGHKEPTRDDIIVTEPGEGLGLVDLAG